MNVVTRPTGLVVRTCFPDASNRTSALPDHGCRFRAEALAAELDVMRELRRRAKAAMLAEACKDPAYELLRTISFFGPVRVAQVLATMQTPWRFRTERNLWAYAGLAVVTYSSGDYDFVEGRPVRRRRQPMTRGLNRNHNRVLKKGRLRGLQSILASGHGRLPLLPVGPKKKE